MGRLKSSRRPRRRTQTHTWESLFPFLRKVFCHFSGGGGAKVSQENRLRQCHKDRVGRPNKVRNFVGVSGLSTRVYRRRVESNSVGGGLGSRGLHRRRVGRRPRPSYTPRGSLQPSPGRRTEVLVLVDHLTPFSLATGLSPSREGPCWGTTDPLVRAHPLWTLYSKSPSSPSRPRGLSATKRTKALTQSIPKYPK